MRICDFFKKKPTTPVETENDMTIHKILLIDKTQAQNAPVKDIARAVNIQLRKHVAPFWADKTWGMSATKGDYPMYIFDDPDVAGALGYHDVGPDGFPYARVFTKPSFDHGSSWLTGPLAISSIVSHEACEMVGDQYVNEWVDNGKNALIARELCDPVESDTYEIDGVVVSNFVTPAWFSQLGGQQYDYLNKLTAPFTMTSGGYLIKMQEGKISQTFGAEYNSPKIKTAGRSELRGIQL